MSDTKETSWKVILGYLLASLCMVALINLILAPRSFFDPISNATFHLINGTLQASLLNILLFSFLVFGWGKLRPSDAGLDRRKLTQGFSLTVLIWLVIQSTVLFISWDSGDIHLDPVWSEQGVTTVLGGLIAQLAGSALYEEMGFRGFYLRQFYLKLKIRDERWRVGGSVVLTTALFILFHIPNEIYHGLSISENFGRLFFWGVILAFIYLFSGNLFLAVGVHALLNQSTLITATGFDAAFPIMFLGLFFAALLWAKKHSVATNVFSPNVKGKQ